MTNSEVAKKKRRERIEFRIRWAYVILAVFTVLSSALTVAFMIKYVQSNDQAWCDIIHASLPSTPPAKPSGPHPDSKQEKRYKSYQLVIALDHKFHC